MSKVIKLPKVTPGMAQALLNMKQGLDGWAHLRGASQYGGYNSTRGALLSRGLIAPVRGEGDQLTELGRQVADDLDDWQK